MKIGWSLVLSLALCGCTSDIFFHAHGSPSRALPIPVAVGVYYTTGTLLMVQDYKNKSVRLFKTWRVHVGDALENEVLSRLRPVVKTLIKVDSPYPESDTDLVLSLGIDQFGFQNARAETIVSAVVRSRDGVVLLDKKYRGNGTTRLADIESKKKTPEQGLGETTRDAMAVAVNALLEDLKPYLARSAPQ